MEIKSKSYITLVNPKPVIPRGIFFLAVVLIFLLWFTIKSYLAGDIYVTHLTRLPIIILLFVIAICFARIKIDEDGIRYTSLFKNIRFKWADVQKVGALHYGFADEGFIILSKSVLLSREDADDPSYNAWLFVCNSNRKISGTEFPAAKSDIIFIRYSKETADLVEYHLMVHNKRLNWNS